MDHAAPTPERQRTLEATLATLGPHDHACLIFASEEEQLHASSTFTRLGLEQGDRCMCVADSGNVERIEGALRRDGLDVDGAMSRGALTVTTERSTYLAQGAFDPDVMCGVLRETAEQARHDGFRALRIAGEVTWALGGDLGSDRIMEYEAKVDALLPRIPCLALCHYDRRRFSADVLRDVIRTHPLAVVRGRLCRNFYHVPPGELTGPDRLHHEVDRLLDNIHEREAAEAALRISERRLALVLEGSQDAFWDWDIPGGAVVFSPQWASQFGVEGVEPRRLSGAWHERMHPEDRAAALASIERNRSGQSDSYQQEYRARAADGSWRWVLSRGAVVERAPDGRPLRMAGTFRDVTEKRALQARLELSSRLAAVGTLAAGVAHEINNPLTFVDANVRWVVEQLDADPGARPELRAALMEALDGAARVREIVQNLRRFARPQAEGSQTTDAVRTELEAVLGMLRRQIEGRARLRTEIAPDLPAVRVGRHELGQVVVNLLVNAAQAIPEGQASEHEVRLRARREGDGLLIEVHDTGQGIAPEVLPHIFDPFYTTKPVGAGTGLGLAISHGIVEAAGGSITVESEPARGAVFRVRLPGADGKPVPAPALQPAPARPKPVARRVLVVDDEPLVCRAVARALSGEHQVDVATSGREALRRAASGERWDVVLCDLLMPELSGHQLLEELERQAPEVAEKVVFMSGASDRGPVDGRWAGRLCLEKPVALEALRELLATRS